MKKVSPCKIYAVINNQINTKGNQLTLQYLCELVGVSRSGYYAYLASDETRMLREKQDLEDFERIKEAFAYRNYPKGAKSIYMYLLHHKIRMNVKKIRRLMKKYGLYCKIRRKNPYKQMAKATKESQVAPNILQRDFLKGPRKVLLTDITYLPYHGKFSYLSTIFDAFTKEILAYRISENLRVEFVLDTVHELILEHGCTLDNEVIVHSDQGTHYTSKDFVELLKSEDFIQSMSRKGNCWDNSPQECFFGHLKDEIAEEIAKCHTHEEVSLIVDDWIDYYNNERYQWGLQKLAPKQFYNFCITGFNPLDDVL